MSGRLALAGSVTTYYGDGNFLMVGLRENRLLPANGPRQGRRLLN
jgi:hypothetical protein